MVSRSEWNVMRSEIERSLIGALSLVPPVDGRPASARPGHRAGEHLDVADCQIGADLTAAPVLEDTSVSMWHASLSE